MNLRRQSMVLELTTKM